MIDIRKALSQRCYIIFDSNEQLVKFLKDNKAKPHNEVNLMDKILSIHDDKFLTLPSISKHKVCQVLPQYHHTELTITDDGE